MDSNVRQPTRLLADRSSNIPVHPFADNALPISRRLSIHIKTRLAKPGQFPFLKIRCARRNAASLDGSSSTVPWGSLRLRQPSSYVLSSSSYHLHHHKQHPPSDPAKTTRPRRDLLHSLYQLCRPISLLPSCFPIPQIPHPSWSSLGLHPDFPPPRLRCDAG